MEKHPLLKHRIINLTGTLTSEKASEVIEQLLLLQAESHEQQIDLYINCPGGSVPAGLAVVDAIRLISAPVATIALGQVASIAVWVLAAGKKWLRMASPNSEIILHPMSADFGDFAQETPTKEPAALGFGPVSDAMQVRGARSRRARQTAATMLAAWTGQNESIVLRDIDRDLFMTATEAAAYGLVDKVAGANRETGGRAGKAKRVPAIRKSDPVSSPVL